MKTFSRILFCLLFLFVFGHTKAQFSEIGSTLFTIDHNVGIGTSVPQARLHIRQDAGISAPSANLRLDDNDATPDKRIDFYEGATSVGYVAHTFNNLFIENDDAGGSIIIDAEGDLIFAGSDVSRMTMKNDGKLGIGTAAPTDKLEVQNGSVNISGGFNTALKVDGDETIWYDGDHFSWGFDGNWNFFNDNINIGATSTEPTIDQAILINNGRNIEFNGSTSVPEIRWLSTTALEMAFIRYQSSIGRLDIESNTDRVVIDGETGIDFNIADGLRMRFDENGNLGIGTSVPAYKLHVVGDACVTGELDVASDARLKKDIVNIEKALDKVQLLKPKSYNFRTDEFPEMELSNHERMGFLAQELEAVMPELVSTGGEVTSTTGESFSSKSVNYLDLVPLLTKAIQEQQDMIEQQRKMIEDINTELQELKKNAKKQLVD